MNHKIICCSYYAFYDLQIEHMRYCNEKGDSQMLPYIPQTLPIKNLDWHRLIPLVSKSNAILSQYNGLLESLVNPHVLLAPMTTKEATLSSKIEGTQATLSEVFRYEAGENYNQEKNEDIEEIQNYRKAMFEAENMLKDKPFIHLNMIKRLHEILLAGVRGNNKARGEFRKIQNWIGVSGSTIENAKYVPPTPTEMMKALDNWEKYINTDDVEDILIQLAFIHAQFEIIHPFLDGNGRIGRILIPLFLYAKQYLKLPVFYLSEYLESNREGYYNHLNAITGKNDWQQWIEFFLNAIILQAEKNTKKAKEVLALYDKMKDRFISVTKSQYSATALDALFTKPIISSAQFFVDAKIDSRVTANRILQKLTADGILEIIKEGKGNQPSTYAFNELLDIV